MDNPVALISHGIVSLAVFVLFVIMTIWLYRVTQTPANPPWFSQYDDLQGKRQSLRSYLASKSKTPENTMVTSLQVATANYGGIFTETKAAAAAWMTPYHGTASPEAARLQVEAGARAIIFDIWPDPSDLSTPIICCMVEPSQRTIDNWWITTGGLNENVGRYSNWNLLTRNKGNVNDIVTAAVNAAFTGVQAEDPFFLILNVHGVLSTAYLNTLGTTILKSLQGKKLGAGSITSVEFCKTPIAALMNKVTVLVNPDLPPSINRDTFNAMYATTQMREVTNLLTSSTMPIVFKNTELSAVTSAAYSDCNGSPTKVALPAASLCVVQPSVGALDTLNTVQFKTGQTGLAGFQECMNSKAQFVGVNLFAGTENNYDDVVAEWLKSDKFGTYSFKI